MPDITMDHLRPVTYRDCEGDPYLEAMIVDPQTNPKALRVGDRVKLSFKGKSVECTIIAFRDVGPMLMLHYRGSAGLEAHNCIAVDAVIRRRDEKR